MKQVSGSKKILNKKQLIKKVALLKKQHKKVITTNGSFDIFHAGHIYLLKKAKSFGDILIVGVNSDASIKKYKNDKRPILPQNSRMNLLTAIEFVDYIYLFNEINPIKFLKIVKPDIHVNSAEYGTNCVEAQVLKKYGGRLVQVNIKKSLSSTSEIIDKIIKLYTKQ